MTYNIKLNEEEYKLVRSLLAGAELDTAKLIGEMDYDTKYTMEKVKHMRQVVNLRTNLYAQALAQDKEAK